MLLSVSPASAFPPLSVVKNHAVYRDWVIEYAANVWFSLPSAKMRQVERVIDYLREHPTAKLTLACQRVFTPAEGNYATAESLQSYCYRHRIWVFAKNTLECEE